LKYIQLPSSQQRGMITVIRHHRCIRGNIQAIQDEYETQIEQGVLPSVNDINEWVLRVLKGKNRGIPVGFSFDISIAMHEAAIANSSFEQYYEDIRPDETRAGQVIGTKTRARICCAICRNTNYIKIKIEPCKCIFHRKCIDEWTKWGDTCPICLNKLTFRP
jgi:hypothetical protein